MLVFNWARVLQYNSNCNMFVTLLHNPRLTPYSQCWYPLLHPYTENLVPPAPLELHVSCFPNYDQIVMIYKNNTHQLLVQADGPDSEKYAICF